MIEYIAKRLSCLLLKKGSISDKSEMEVIEYSIKALLLFILNVTVFIVLSILSRNFIYSLFMIISFLVYRVYNYGYHASTPCKCFIMSLITWCIGMYISLASSNFSFYLGLYAFSLLTFCIINRYINTFYGFNKRKIQIITFSYAIIVLYLYFNNNVLINYISTGIFLAISGIVINMLIKNKT